MDDLYSREVRLPNGKTIRSEVVHQAMDMKRGMMFRDSLASDRGMLFMHGTPGEYPYWMYQVRIPLDIIWLDSSRRITEMSLNTPPCKAASSSQCPNYGGTKPALYILELAAGEAPKNKLQVGDRLEF